ncbi:NADPH:quinone reductase-like Zn-dependent oxidoreductase [Scopulibacillus daqui]|uniref:NADPH:quinone reductase-like Zn-dependent oxidoreductase n=1 Tax=Scopulibacillus daqui TaxID=1469162 RepID=A0ABS2Q3Y0_9BACL|nr:NADPH:quinone reductase-like Zn-dependent oxidoreductase [Scopulibacillus daqui]
MKAIVHKGEEGLAGVAYIDINEPQVKGCEVKIKLKTAGLNHRDLFVLSRHSGVETPLVIGSDGAGIIEEIGEGVEGLAIGQEVVIIPSLRWREKSPAPPEDHEILGMPDNGTFAESIVINAEQVSAKPKHLTWEEAGVLPLGALTAYRAMFTRGNLQAGQTVFIPGAGSGVATFLVQMAKAAGARVSSVLEAQKKMKKPCS